MEAQRFRRVGSLGYQINAQGEVQNGEWCVGAATDDLPRTAPEVIVGGDDGLGEGASDLDTHVGHSEAQARGMIFGQMQVAMGYVVSPLSLAFTIFMTFLELLVALIQAYVFTLLSALYFGMATAEH